MQIKHRIEARFEHAHMQHIAHISLVVNEYDEAIDFYVQKLGFKLTEDTRLSEEKRWVIVTPTGGGCSLLLAKAANEQQKAAVGNQTGGRVFLFLYTEDFQADYAGFKSKGVVFVRPPEQHDYGTVAVFADVCGNLWDLIQPAIKTRLQN